MDKCIPDAAIRKAWLDLSMTSAEAAQSIGISRSQLWLRARKLKLPARPDGRREVIPREVLAPLWHANVRIADIAAIYGCPVGSVSQSARRYELTVRSKGKHALISLDDYLQRLLGQRMAKQAAAELAVRKRAISEIAASEIAAE